MKKFLAGLIAGATAASLFWLAALTRYTIVAVPGGPATLPTAFRLDRWTGDMKYYYEGASYWGEINR